MYDAVFFNFHDVALILVAFQSLIFGSLLLCITRGKPLSNRLLGLFVFSLGLEAIDTLIYWCLPLKEQYLAGFPEVFFAFKVTLLLQGPLLFIYVKSLIYRDFAFRQKDLMHFIPALIYPFYAALMVANIGQENLAQGVLQYSYYWDNPYYHSLVMVQAIVVSLYALASVRLILGYNERLKESYSSIGEIGRGWLKVLIIGFTVICLWNLASHLLGSIYSSTISSTAGLAGNYVDLIFMNLLVFYNLLHSHVVLGISDPWLKKAGTAEVAAGSMTQECAASTSSGVEEKNPFPAHTIDAIEQAMHKKQVYLIHDLTLDQLAETVRLSPREVSNIINRHYGMNFFDFINFHRVARARTLLISEPEKTVLEVWELSGFNSKSAFHRFFKKFVAVTPTEYRRAKSGSAASQLSPEGYSLSGANGVTPAAGSKDP